MYVGRWGEGRGQRYPSMHVPKYVRIPRKRSRYGVVLRAASSIKEHCGTHT